MVQIVLYFFHINLFFYRHVTSKLSTVNKVLSKYTFIIIAVERIDFRILITTFIFQALERLAQLIRAELSENYIENIDT